MTVQDVTVHFRQFAPRDHLTGRRAYVIFSHCKFRETYQTNHRNVRDCFLKVSFVFATFDHVRALDARGKFSADQ